MSIVYAPAICVGLDLRKVIHRKPKHLTEEAWKENFVGFWPTYIDHVPYPSLEMYFVEYLDGKSTIVYGTSVFDFLNERPTMSYHRYQAHVARMISRALNLEVHPKLIQHYNTSTIVEIDGLTEEV